MHIHAKSIILTETKLSDLFFLSIFLIFSIYFYRILILGWKFEVSISIFVYFFMINLKALWIYIRTNLFKQILKKNAVVQNDNKYQLGALKFCNNI